MSWGIQSRRVGCKDTRCVSGHWCRERYGCMASTGWGSASASESESESELEPVSGSSRNGSTICFWPLSRAVIVRTSKQRCVCDVSPREKSRRTDFWNRYTDARDQIISVWVTCSADCFTWSVFNDSSAVRWHQFSVSATPLAVYLNKTCICIYIYTIRGY